MNDYSEYFNPELEAILQEIARDPRAKLLKVPSSGALIWATKQPRVGIAAPGLTFAERELLTVHRDELAERLKERCLIELYSTKKAKTVFHKSVAIGQTLHIRSGLAWKSETKSLLERDIEDETLRVAADSLRACINVESGRTVSVVQLATAMLRIAPKQQGHIYAALDLLARERPSEALELQKRTLKENPSRLIESFAHEGMAVAYWKMQRFGDALEASHNAVKVHGTRVVPLLSCIDISARIGDIQTARLRCHQLDDLDCSGDSGIAWFLNKDRNMNSLAVPSVESRCEIQELMDDVGKTSREILNAALF